MEKEKHEETLLENEVEMKGWTTPLQDLKRIVIRPETKRRLMMETNDECSLLLSVDKYGWWSINTYIPDIYSDYVPSNSV